MTMYAKVQDQTLVIYPYTPSKLRQEHPNTSFPQKLTPDLLAQYGIVPVTPTDPPTFDSYTEFLSETAALVDGAWTQEWSVNQDDLDTAERNVRNRRDTLLSESDWTQVLDAPVDQAAWSVYRQALRDIPSQPDFPYSVNWPVAPSA